MDTAQTTAMSVDVSSQSEQGYENNCRQFNPNENKTTDEWQFKTKSNKKQTNTLAGLNPTEMKIRYQLQNTTCDKKNFPPTTRFMEVYWENDKRTELEWRQFGDCIRCPYGCVFSEFFSIGLSLPS